MATSLPSSARAAFAGQTFTCAAPDCTHAGKPLGAWDFPVTTTGTRAARCHECQHVALVRTKEPRYGTPT